MLGSQLISSAPALSVPPAAKAGATVPDKAAKAKTMAREFEATFLSMLLKEMRQTLDPDAGLFPGDTGDVQGGLFDMFLGKHLADTGGVGLAAVLERQVGPAAQPTHPTNATTDRPAAGTAPPPPA